MSIISAIKDQKTPGRFLEKSIATGSWYVVSEQRAIAKTSQALRERGRAPKCQRRRKCGSDDDIDDLKASIRTTKKKLVDVDDQMQVINNQVHMTPEQDLYFHGTRITGLDITAIFDVDPTQIGQFSDGDIEEWIKCLFLPKTSARMLELK